MYYFVKEMNIELVLGKRALRVASLDSVELGASTQLIFSFFILSEDSYVD